MECASIKAKVAALREMLAIEKEEEDWHAKDAGKLNCKQKKSGERCSLRLSKKEEAAKICIYTSSRELI